MAPLTNMMSPRAAGHALFPGSRMLLFLPLLLLSIGSRPVTAQTSLSNLSSCGLTCLVGGISRSNCSLSDVACSCASATVVDAVTDCLLANCTMQDSLDVSRYTAYECNYANDSQATEVIVILSALYGVAVVFVVMRAMSKLITRTFCTEDYILIAAVVLSAVSMACALRMAQLGFGNHLWNLHDGALGDILRLFYVAEIFYVVALALTKASIVYMYLRIFRAHPPFQIACYAALGFILVPTLIIVLATIFSCSPVAYFWDRDIRGGGHCLDVTALAYANSGFAAAQDVVLIALPILMLRRLNMSRRRKCFIGFMFAVGGLGLVATAARLRTLGAFVGIGGGGGAVDPSWDYVPVVYWTVVELAAGVICACMPAVRILLERFSRAFQLSAAERSLPAASAGPGQVAFKMDQYPPPQQQRNAAPAPGSPRPWTSDASSQRGLRLSCDLGHGTAAGTPTLSPLSVVTDTSPIEGPLHKLDLG